MAFLLLLTSAFIIYHLTLTIYNLYLSPLSHIPGPWYTAISSVPTKYHSLLGNRIHFVHALHQRYGPIIRVTPTEISLTALSAAREIYSPTSPTPYLKTSWYTRFMRLTRDNVFTMLDPSAHRSRRRLLTVSSTSITDLYELLRSKVDLAVTKIHRDACGRGGGGGGADVLKWWQLMAGDTVATLTFGKSFGMVESEEKIGFVNDLKDFGFLTSMRAAFPVLPWLGRLFPGVEVFSRFERVKERVENYGAQAVENLGAANGGEVVLSDGTRKPTLFSKILREKELDRLDLAAEAADFVVAGGEPVALTLAYTVWCVLKHPEVHQKLVDELQPLKGLELAEVDDRMLVAISYLQRVIDETMRLYGPVPDALRRAVPKGGRILAEHYIPQGTTVSTQSFSLHRSPEIYTEPLKYQPERWENPTDDMKAAFMPFGGGTRICLGMPLAHMEMRRAIAVFFLTCGGPGEVVLAPSCTDDCMWQQNYFLISPKGRKVEVQVKSGN